MGWSALGNAPCGDFRNPQLAETTGMCTTSESATQRWLHCCAVLLEYMQDFVHQQYEHGIVEQSGHHEGAWYPYQVLSFGE